MTKESRPRICKHCAKCRLIWKGRYLEECIQPCNRYLPPDNSELSPAFSYGKGLYWRSGEKEVAVEVGWGGDDYCFAEECLNFEFRPLRGEYKRFYYPDQEN